jgi:hypothetical protein
MGALNVNTGKDISKCLLSSVVASDGEIIPVLRESS